jgi:hypothetical protein
MKPHPFSRFQWAMTPVDWALRGEVPGVDRIIRLS